MHSQYISIPQKAELQDKANLIVNAFCLSQIAELQNKTKLIVTHFDCSNSRAVE